MGSKWIDLYVVVVFSVFLFSSSSRTPEMAVSLGVSGAIS